MFFWYQGMSFFKYLAILEALLHHWCLYMSKWEELKTRTISQTLKQTKDNKKEATYGSSGVSCTGSSVKAGSKCSRSRSDLRLGLYGGVTSFCSSTSHWMARKNGWDWMSLKPESWWHPSLSAGFCIRLSKGYRYIYRY